MKKPLPVVVAIPVKDEEALIGSCLSALAAQSQPSDAMILLLNNCTDRTLAICREIKSAPMPTIIECTLAGPLASAGEARRLALDYALTNFSEAVILTTDADAVPALNWIEKNLAAIANGADVVCGMALVDPNDYHLLPEDLHFAGKREADLLSILDEIECIVDPDPADPWPRHQQNSGASIAMRASTLRLAGGPPHVANGEDRELIKRFQMIDARIRHDDSINVRVSGRLEGRATEGMASTMKRRLKKRDEFADGRLEPTVDAYRRVLAKVQARDCWRRNADTAVLAANLLISEAVAAETLRAPYFGVAWTALQKLSPMLQRRRIHCFDVERETRQALRLRDELLIQRDHSELEFSGPEIAG